MLLYILIVIFIILISINISIHGTKKAKKFNEIPSIKSPFLIGQLYEMVSSPVELFYKGRAMANVFKDICGFWFFNIPVINLYDPEDIEIILSNVKYIEKGLVYDYLHPWLKDGLLTSKGGKWQVRRKILTPTFHFNILRQFCAIFTEQSALMVEKLKKEVGKSETIILPFVTNFALQTICETAMGTNLDSGEESVSKYKSAIYAMGEYIVYRFARLWLKFDSLYRMSTVGKLQKKALISLHNFTTSVIRERRKERNASKASKEDENTSDDESHYKKKRLAMLDLLLSAEDEGKINEDGIREEVDTFMFEGHDTTTMAITFALMLFANHPEIQDLAVAELNEILGDSDRVPTIEDLNNMRYLERCIKEALRLYPSVPFISRTLVEDVQLRKHFLPAGTGCNIHIFDVHRDPRIYPNPSKFDPDRFLLENSQNRHPYAYIPFSAGPRNCIGQKFAILEEKSIISAVLRNFILEPVTRPDDIIFSADLVLRCINPVKVKFLHRKLTK